MEKVASIVAAALQIKAEGMTHWSLPDAGQVSEPQQVCDEVVASKPVMASLSRHTIVSTLSLAALAGGTCKLYCRLNTAVHGLISPWGIPARWRE